jgi:hypothetical protein
VKKETANLDYSRTDMRGAAGVAVESDREPVATKQIGSPLGQKKPMHCENCFSELSS